MANIIRPVRSLMNWEGEEKEIAFAVETIIERCPMPGGSRLDLIPVLVKSNIGIRRH